MLVKLVNYAVEITEAKYFRFLIPLSELCAALGLAEHSCCFS